MDNELKHLQQLFSEGSELLQAGNAEQALNCFLMAQHINPSNPTLFLFCGAALHELKRFDEAIDCYEKTIRLSPSMGEAHNNMGNTLIALGRFAEAVIFFSNAVTLLPTSPVPLAARATALQAIGKIAEAEADCRTALAIAPEFAEAHWNLALNLLLQGHYDEGWREYEWRWRKSDFTSPIRHEDVPLWDGSPLNGRTILLHAEQGFGDAIQFVRYAPLVAERGGIVIVECHPELVSLFQKIKGISSVFAFGEGSTSCDFQAPFLSLPNIFTTTLESIPACPYLLVSSELSTEWQQRLSVYSGLKVGIVWAGSSIHHNDIFRSLQVDFLSSLADCTAIKLFSLQMGDAKKQLALSPLRDTVSDFTDQIHSFSDSAALIQKLDLVISVDTAVAHLAGSLGIPVWLLLPFAPDWRWLLVRRDSPWYPTMRLFRQETLGEWKPVINDLTTALTHHIQKNKAP